MSLADVKAMAFYSGDSLEHSYGSARRFAGDGGHVATLPEIISARKVAPYEAGVWNHWYTTASSEFYGLSRGGNPIIIVAHGVGPLTNAATITSVYDQAEYIHNETVARVSLDTFRRLEAGDFGDVTIVDADLSQIYPHPFLSAADLYQAGQDKLLQARLGPDWQQVAYCLMDYTRFEQLPFRPPMKSLRSKGPTAYPGEWELEYPLGHLLTVSSLTCPTCAYEDGGSFATFDVDCADSVKGTRFIGVRPGGDLSQLHDGPAQLMKLAHARQLLLPNPLPPTQASFFVLTPCGNDWFTRVHSRSTWPEFLVTKLELVGAPSSVEVPVSAATYHVEPGGVAQQAPEGANAYYLGEPQRFTRGGEDFARLEVMYCRVTLDETRKVPSYEVLEQDYDLQMSLLESSL